MSVVSNLTFTRGDVVVGGTTLSGNKTVVNNVDGADVAKNHQVPVQRL